MELNTNVYNYLNARYNEQVVLMQINIGQIFNELNFSVKGKLSDEVPDPEFVELKYPKISDSWISKQYNYESFEKLTNTDEVHYNYSFGVLHRRLFSLHYYWLLSSIDNEARILLESCILEITRLIKFVALNTVNMESWNTYLEIWIGMFRNIVERNNSYLINGVQFGDYISKQGYDNLILLLTSNKR